MKTLEFNQMENINGGDYGDVTCGQFWNSASIAFSIASPYIAVFPGGAAIVIAGGIGVAVAGMFCEEE